MLVFGTNRLDPIASLAIAVLVVGGAWTLLRDSTRVLLEAVPSDIDVAAVRAALAEQPGVEAVHHLHVWALGAEDAALSAHVVLGGPLSLHDAEERATELKGVLAERFGIEHATLEVECHACIDDHVHARPEPRTRAWHTHPAEPPGTSTEGPHAGRRRDRRGTERSRRRQPAR